MLLLKSLWAFLRAVFGNARQLALENLALRQQLVIYERRRKKPKLRRCDRIFWVWLSRLWKGWASALLIVKPETVVASPYSLSANGLLALLNDHDPTSIPDVMRTTFHHHRFPRGH